MNAKTGYHFVGDKLRDGRPVPPDGVWLVHEGPIKMCKSGLHLSRKPFDALQYAPGATLCRVLYGGEVIEDEDKVVCTRREIIARFDATELLRTFARSEALSVIHLWNAPDVVVRYLKTGDQSLRAAAGAAAWDATWAAAGAAAGAAAWDAAWDATWAAAGAAARDAAWDATSRRFNRLVYAQFRRKP